MANILVVGDEKIFPSLGKLPIKIDIANKSKPYSKHCLLKAQNDIEAVRSWLHEYKNRTETHKSYEREADRLLLWCAYENGKTLSNLSKEDFESFILFLQKPPKAWCMRRKGKKIIRGQGAWRPFYGPLSTSAMHKSVRIINSLMNYLVNADYLRANPLKLIKYTSRFSIDNEAQKYQVWDRMLEDDEWQAIQKILADLPESTTQEANLKMTTQFLFALLYFLGIRINEAASHSWNAFREFQGDWWFFVKGKGDKLGHVPVNDELFSYIKTYRLHLGKTPIPSSDESEPIFYSNKTKGCISTRWLYKLVKDIGQKAAMLFPEGSKSYEKLCKISPHWLRHLSASHQDKLGVPISVIQANHRHASRQTTQIYVHAEDEIRFEHMQKMKMAVKPKLISPEIYEQNDILGFILSGGGLGIEVSLARFLDVIEQEILVDFNWSRSEVDTEKLIKEFKKNKRFGQGLKIVYKFDVAVDLAILDILQKAVQREAEFRMFKINNELFRG